MALIPLDGGRGAKLASATARDLRELAELVESGKVRQVVSIALIEGGEFRVESNATHLETVALASILHDWALSKIRA